ncbi:glutamate racemase [Mycoplasma sp. P36-A1]|uniref:glutamate racemase n=1 Tax=Mycoplasma sp. P36-A1 TaxID=3252900 RepID=UPI003C2E53CA
MNNSPIGIFDSGVGGLSVLKKVVKVLPNESIVYFADTARCPYGPKTLDTIYNYSKQICNFLISQHKVKAIIIACNTATIASIDRLKLDFDIPIIGVPDYGAQDANEQTINKKIGLLATDATVNSNYYQNKLKGYDQENIIIGQGCPEFVLDVESNNFAGDTVEKHVKEYTEEMVKEGVDTIILGCTHFPFLKDTINKVLNNSVKIIDPADSTVNYVASYLKEHNLLASDNNKASIELFSSSDHNETLISLIKGILNEDKTVTQIDIDTY